MHITIICIPYQVDVARWGCANGPQAFLDHGLLPLLEATGPEQSPGGLTPAPSWPPREHILEAARATVQTLPVKVASLAVYNPAADTDGRGVRFGLASAQVSECSERQ